MTSRSNLRAVAVRAPRPTRSSYARSLYDALQAINGEATLQQIIEMLPATDDASRWTKATPTKVLSLLNSSRYFGYFVETADYRWKIAPKDYYDQRQQMLADRQNELTNAPQKSKRRSTARVIEIVKWKHAEWIELGCAFVAGIAIGIITATAL